MSDMKCPFCGQELDTSNYYIRCHNPHCNTTVEMEGTEELWQERVRTRKALEQSEICCTEWKKQALDYKAENIALSVKSEFVVDVLKEIDKLLSSNKFVVNECPLLNITQTKISMLLKFINIKQITALE